MSKEENTRESELMRVRQHPIVLLRAVLVNAVALVVLAGISRALEIYGFLLLYLIPLTILFFEVYVWFGRKFIITESRIIQAEPFLFARTMDLPLRSIGRVVYKQSILGKLLRYGTIKLEIAGQEAIVAFYFVPGAAEFCRCIAQPRAGARIPLDLGSAGARRQ